MVGSINYCIFASLLCNIIQNSHLYDGGIEYQQLRLVTRLKVCALVMHHVCKRFGDGDASTSRRNRSVSVSTTRA